MSYLTSFRLCWLLDDSTKKSLVVKITLIILFTLLITGCVTSKYAHLIHSSTPDHIDINKHYLFFMHGKIVEYQGVNAFSRKYGSYAYQSMLDSFAENGFFVISKNRSSGTDIYDYSINISEQVEKLIKAGVPPSNITVSGFSKGGRMTLVVSSLLNYKDMNYVVLAGCRTSDIKKYNLNPSGKVLSIFDSDDDSFESCSEIFSHGKDNLYSSEIVLDIGSGHGVFYRPIPEWVDPMMKWAKK